MTSNTGGSNGNDTPSPEERPVGPDEADAAGQRLSIPSNLWDTGLFKPAW